MTGRQMKRSRKEMEQRLIDIRDYDEIVQKVNRIINKGGIVELKLENHRTQLAVVEIQRKLIKE